MTPMKLNADCFMYVPVGNFSDSHMRNPPKTIELQLYGVWKARVLGNQLPTPIQSTAAEAGPAVRREQFSQSWWERSGEAGG